MPAFTGFPSGKSPFVPLPDVFFTQVAPKIEDVGELKLLLHLFWLLYRKRGTPRCASDRELAGDATLRRALRRQGDPRPFEERLRAALESALAHGVLLRVRVRVDGEIVTWYLFNTERSRHAVAEILRGEISPEVLLDAEEGGNSHLYVVEVERPNIFTLYEQNVGLLLPLVAEELREAEARYPREWVVDAFRQAVQQNKRKWSYIRAILRRWETEGKGA
ncbi:MAG TPA: DnaD domain protein [Ktedonobacterales bacterium]